MGGNGLVAQPFEALVRIRGCRQPVIGGSAGQSADGRPIGAKPKTKPVASLDHIPDLLAQAVAFRETPGMETMHGTGGNARGQSFKAEIGRWHGFVVEGAQPAQQLEHGFARQLGGVCRSIKGT